MTPQQQQQIEVASPPPLRLSLPNRTSPRIRANNTGSPDLETLSGVSPQTIRIALAGCGVVGGGLVRLLHESAAAIASRFGVRFVITSVLVRDVSRDRKLPIDPSLFTSDLEAFLAKDADVVIEAVGGDEPARTIAISSLRRGRKLITANKQLIASHGDVLSAIATLNDTALDFGAAVGGSAPVISTLRDLVGAAAPLAVRGILNGTSNYVISRLESGDTFEAALASAKERGLAESDCGRDLDGTDVVAKLSIIAWIAFGIRPSELLIRKTSLLPGIEQLVRLTGHAGGRVRLLGECTQLDAGNITASVEPVIVSPTSAFARTTLEENRVEVDLGWSSPLSVSGPGAGAAPTAAALLGDLVRTSPPSNDRGLAARQFVSVADPRSHSWLVGARLEQDALKALVQTAELPIYAVLRDHDYTAAITTAAPWSAVEKLVQDLARTNASPCVARYDLGQPKEVIL